MHSEQRLRGTLGDNGESTEGSLPQKSIQKQQYDRLLRDLKQRIRSAQGRASMSVNRELISLYWQIGREILQRLDTEGWGTKVIDRLAEDLGREFPGVEGFSGRNLRYMRKLAAAWPDPELLPQVVAIIPWGHHRALLDKIKEPQQRLWYARGTIEHGWSRAVLLHHIGDQSL